MYTFFVINYIRYVMKQAMRKEKICYDKNKNKRKSIPIWKTERWDNFDPRKKNNKFHKNIGNNYKGYQGSNYKNFKPNNSTTK